jgi:hypothetical protein
MQRRDVKGPVMVGERHPHTCYCAMCEVGLTNTPPPPRKLNPFAKLSRFINRIDIFYDLRILRNKWFG